MAETPPLPRILTADAFCEALIGAGVVSRGDRYRRIVIDAEAGSAVRIYAERFGDERLLDVIPALDGIQVVTGQETP